MNPVAMTENNEFAPAVLTYTNYRGEVSTRRIIPHRPYFGATEHHPVPQWILSAYDLDKGAVRDFALKDFGLTVDREQLTDAIHEAVSGAYDCTRAWSAWNVGTMTASDFVPVEDRAEEIADAILLSLRSSPAKVPTLSPIPEINVHAEVEAYEWRGDGDYTPNEKERALLEDFGNGLISKFVELLANVHVVSRSTCVADAGEARANAAHEYYASLPPYHLTKAEFEALPEYSATLPTGTTPGKMWKRHDGAHDPSCKEPFWILGQYDPEDDGKGPNIKINWYVPVLKLDARLSNGSE